MSDDNPVAKAALILDAHLPGWHQRVDIEKLEMADCELCMLGQTFGRDVEYGIAAEMYPEEWAEARLACAKHAAYGGWSKYTAAQQQRALSMMDGYTIGREFFKRRLGTVPEDLDAACSGTYDNCTWIKEIATRRATDDLNRQPVKGEEPINA